MRTTAAVLLTFALAASGCVSAGKCDDYAEAMYRIGVAHGKAEAALESLRKSFKKDAAHFDASTGLMPSGPGQASHPIFHAVPVQWTMRNNSFAQASKDAACETDRRFIADPNTPEEFREVMYKSLSACRTAEQERALNRLTCGEDACR